MHRLRILIVFWASTLVDEICQIASKDKAIAKAKLIPLVFFRRHGSATSASSASLRPFGVPCITLAGWKSMEKRLPVALRAVARFKSAKKGRRDAKLMHVVARSAKWDAATRRTREWRKAFNFKEISIV